MWIDEQKKILSVYECSRGSFGLDYGDEIDWLPCRETFHAENGSVELFYFAHGLPLGRGRSVSVFFDKFEDLLGLSQSKRLNFGPTNKRRVMWVRMTPWWRLSIRRSLMTALLRQSMDYRIHLDNFEACLYDGTYLKSTRAAIDRFIAGNTYYRGREIGWVSAFVGRNQKYLEESLKDAPKKQSA